MNKAMQLKDKIKNLASKNHVPAQAVLQNFMLERLLERISLSNYGDKIILKGGMLIGSMVGINNRTTMDMDATLCNFPIEEGKIRRAGEEICAFSIDDEVTFVLDHIDLIREADEYGGYRLAITAKYESINIPLKIDITCGDIITPHPVRYIFSSIFDNKRIAIWAYNSETIMAEKVETILRRSVLNTRPRDYYDVYILMKEQGETIDMGIFRTALNATAENRGSLMVLKDKDAILQTIRLDLDMRQRWTRYTIENFYAKGIDFDDIIDMLVDILK